MSKTIAVFPVCLSPIINSLWPLPIGIIESIALIPVCKGEFTDSLAKTFGASFSKKLNCGLSFSANIGPLPSIGFPNGSTTLPNNCSPTAIESNCFVLLTVSPDFIKFASPKTKAPTESSSKFSATARICPERAE